MTDKPAPREVKIVHPDYQPSKAELEEDLRVDALSQPVSIHYINRPGSAR